MMARDLKEAALAYIAKCDDPVKLKRMARNARQSGDSDVNRAASLKLYEVSPEACPGTLEHEVMQSIYALEDVLSIERGRTTRLARTRQKIGRDGIQKTVADLISGNMSDGFQMLADRDMLERTFEAIALRFPDQFNSAELRTATERLNGARKITGGEDYVIKDC